MKILDMGQITLNKLHYSLSEITDHHIHSLIPPKQHKRFDKEFSKFVKSDGSSSIPFDLELITSEGFTLKIKCQFERLHGESSNSFRYLVLGTKILTHNEVLEDNQRDQALSNFQKRKTKRLSLSMKTHGIRVSLTHRSIKPPEWPGKSAKRPAKKKFLKLWVKSKQTASLKQRSISFVNKFI